MELNGTISVLSVIWDIVNGKTWHGLYISRILQQLNSDIKHYQPTYDVLTGASWTSLPECVWTVSTWPSTRFLVSWMWIWSCAPCLMRICPLTCGRLSAAWCSTCMWTVTHRSRSHLSNMPVFGLRFPPRLLLMSEFISWILLIDFYCLVPDVTASLRFDSSLIIQLWQRWNHQRWDQRAVLPYNGFCGKLPERGGVTEHSLLWQGKKQAYLWGNGSVWIVWSNEKSHRFKSIIN